ncbi:uncharacterized protein LOC116779616 [Danaus plexippus]|uniref:Defensin n=1 Tax=Danaus plexippus plexippus TaxID=278856 RepID=A0A212EHU1_DANPL|nr:uncharacterized protein LOC116779616 [Danaus plexippus]OWR41056.1 defensin [Danaus plexippus plexippus]
MARDSIYTLLVFTVICSINFTVAFPRDSSVIRTEPLTSNNDDVASKVKEISPQTITVSDSVNEFKIPGRISCPHEEATEDPSCLEHCLPKGYSYGLCVSHICSCI